MFEGWDNFYLMLGPAAAGLIGLLFVVVTLTAGFDRSKAVRGQALYLTPTALHFGMVMVISAIAMAPRLGAGATTVAIEAAALAGLAGAVRASIGIRGMKTGENDPHWSDFWCYGIAPIAIYLGLGAAALALCWRAAWAAETIAALLLILLALNVRNAWDLVTTIAAVAKDGG
ncbi:MAG TPA: hypothetical protein VGL73_03935 [Caulobacteraceae bacterium]|jgi:hypothetical protein